jgi:hypothetical protein
MVGRIELITPEQRAMARSLAELETASSPDWFYKAINKMPPKQRSAATRALTSGTKTLAEVGIEAPADYAMYLKIGRFRDAIVLDEHRRRPTPTLGKFVRNYHLDYFSEPSREADRPARRGTR